MNNDCTNKDSSDSKNRINHILLQHGDCDLLVIFSSITSKYLVVKTNSIQNYIDTLNP